MGLSLIEIFSIIFIHWVADFVLQTDKQAKGKSKNWSDLLGHTITYTLSWFAGFIIVLIALFIYEYNCKILLNLPFDYHIYWFLPITFICHTITDYFTSRLNSKLWAKGDTHNFFVSVGFDQVLHYVQLFLTYYLLKNI
jgi:hypothetical protein